MNFLQFEHNAGTGITDVFASPQAAAILAIGGAAGVAGTLLVQNLIKIIQGDPVKIVERLTEWLLKIKKVLDNVIDRIMHYKPEKQGRRVWITGLKTGMREPEDMKEEYNLCVSLLQSVI